MLYGQKDKLIFLYELEAILIRFKVDISNGVYEVNIDTHF
jgi:hypothetical protein